MLSKHNCLKVLDQIKKLGIDFKNLTFILPTKPSKQLQLWCEFFYVTQVYVGFENISGTFHIYTYASYYDRSISGHY